MFSERSGIQKLLFLKAALAGGGSAIERTAIGNPLTFSTDLSRPLKSLLIPFTPVQSGTGDPSPQNIRSILPWNGLKVFGGGKNILNPAHFAESSEFYSVDNGIITAKKSDYRAWSSLPKLFLRAGTYTISKSTAEGLMVVRSSLNDYSSSVVYAEGVASGKFRLSADAYIAIKPSENMSYPATFTLQLEVGQTATAYEPYKPITETDISFPSPVYGGEHEAVSGKLMDGWAVKVFDGSLDELWDKISSGSASAFAMQIQISGKSTSADSYMCDSLKNIARNATWGNYDNWISDNQNSIVTGIKAITTVADWRAYLAEHPITVAYKLATPQEQTLTGHQITALVGNNTIWSDADGSMTAVYLVSEAYAEDHPVSGGLGSGLLGGGLGSGSEDPGEDPVEDPGQEEGPDPEEGEGE